MPHHFDKISYEQMKNAKRNEYELIRRKNKNKSTEVVRDVLAQKFPHVKNVFIPDATSHKKRDNEKHKMKNLKLVEPSILVPRLRQKNHYSCLD
jgi:hypothetical protein